MLTRLVRMHFTPGRTEEFLIIFNENKEAIRKFPGCTSVELLRDTDDESCYGTLSHWNDAASLERYRQSELFGTVWKKVKPLFAAKTEAFSMEVV